EHAPVLAPRGKAQPRVASDESGVANGAGHHMPCLILPIFCLLSVPGTSRTSADTLAGNAHKIETFRRPPMSADVRTTRSHGENRGSSPLGSANQRSDVLYEAPAGCCRLTGSEGQNGRGCKRGPTGTTLHARLLRTGQADAGQHEDAETPCVADR